MKTSIYSLLAAVLLGTAAAVDAPALGYSVADITWKVQATHDGPYYEFNGTVQEVRSQLKKINPDFDQEFPPATATSSKRSAKLAKRDTVLCNNIPADESAKYGAIVNGISYLRTVSGQPTNGPGPGNCGRVSCSDDSAIWWCNDASSSKTLPGFGNIADSAQLIIDTCAGGAGTPYDIPVQGQDFHTDDWNGIVSSAQC